MKIISELTNNVSSGFHPASVKNRQIAFTSVSGILPFVFFLDSIGAPTSRFLRLARIPVSLVETPEASLPLHQTYVFAELAARHEGIDNFGLVVGQNTTLDDIGPYGYLIQQSSTVYDYLQKGIQLISCSTTSEHFWLSREGETLRFNHAISDSSAYGQSQGDLFALIITINTLRKHADPNWQPTDLRLASCHTESLPEIACLADTAISKNGHYSSFAIPRDLLTAAFHYQKPPLKSGAELQQQLQSTMPTDFVGAVRQVTEMMLLQGHSKIEVVAEACGLSTRTLQRRLTELGLNYVQLVKDTRINMAAQWLKTNDITVNEIAHNLGYTDPSNFTRAFRQQTGLSPQAFRLQHINLH